MTREQTRDFVRAAALKREYRRLRDEFYAAGERADASFGRWFAKAQAGEPTNAATATRLANEASYLLADLVSAQNDLYRVGIDPHDLDDADGVERSPL